MIEHNLVLFIFNVLYMCTGYVDDLFGEVLRLGSEGSDSSRAVILSHLPYVAVSVVLIRIKQLWNTKADLCHSKTSNQYNTPSTTFSCGQIVSYNIGY